MRQQNAQIRPHRNLVGALAEKVPIRFYGCFEIALPLLFNSPLQQSLGRRRLAIEQTDEKKPGCQQAIHQEQQL
jgi:hypothetical protein